MKIFISADIEGVTGITDWAEADPTQPDYAEFRERMTAEVAAACAGALAAGASAIVVKDAHWTGRNLQAERLPQPVQLLRSWSGHPYGMVQGLDESFDAALFVGWHSGAWCGGNPLAHTLSSSRLMGLRVNGQWVSEFQLYAWAAALERVPVLFVSGDAALCETVRTVDARIATVAVSRGLGAATLAEHPAVMRERIRSEVERCLQTAPRAQPLALPPHFDVQVVCKDARHAWRKAFYPGARLLDPNTIGFQSDACLELLRMLQFITRE